MKLELSDEVCRRARAKGYQGRVVGLAIRGRDLQGIYRTRTIREYTSIASDVFHTAAALFEEHWESDQPVRLLGITLGQLHRFGCVQLEMFTTRNKAQCLAAAVDAIIKRHGTKSLTRATSLTEASLFYEPKQTVGGSSHAPARIPHPSFDVRRS